MVRTEMICLLFKRVSIFNIFLITIEVKLSEEHLTAIQVFIMKYRITLATKSNNIYTIHYLYIGRTASPSWSRVITH